MTDNAIDDRILGALSPLDAGDLPRAIAGLEALLESAGEQEPIIDAFAGLGDWNPLREPRDDGKFLIDRMVLLQEKVASPRHRVTLLIALAELETTQRDPNWAAWWIKKAIHADHSDLRPWDALELLMDAFPGLPVDKQTLTHLREIRIALEGDTDEDDGT